MKTRVIPLVFLSLLPGLVHALGLGPVTTQSYLGEPFSARIEILSATVPEQDSLIVILGNEAAFQRAGLELTREIKTIQFKVVGSESGESYIQVTSKDPVREPVLSFVVEARWIGGQMARTYTVLLDPPFYAAVERRKPIARKETPPPPTEMPAQTVTEEPQRVPPGPPTMPAQTAPVLSTTSADQWTVGSGDTLWAIASRMRPNADVSTDQMMIALLHANPDAFLNGNINTIKHGAILQRPTMEEIQAINKLEATDQVRNQYTDWKQAQAGPGVPETTAETGQPGLLILTPDSKTESISSDTGGTPGEHNIDSLKKELAMTAESIESYRTENTELEARLSAAEARIEDLKAELKKGLEVNAPLPVQAEAKTDQYGPVAAGATLWMIANQLRPDVSISVNQMMLALLRANPEAFINGNINRLKSGVILHVPAGQDILSISKEAAAAEVSAQYTEWKRRR